MKNFRHNGKVISHSAPGVVVSGMPVSIGVKAGIAAGDYAAGVEGEYAMGGVFSFVDDGTNHAQGALVGYDISAGHVVTDIDINKDFDLGYVTKAGAAGVVEVMVNSIPY